MIGRRMRRIAAHVFHLGVCEQAAPHGGSRGLGLGLVEALVERRATMTRRPLRQRERRQGDVLGQDGRRVVSRACNSLIDAPIEELLADGHTTYSSR